MMPQHFLCKLLLSVQYGSVAGDLQGHEEYIDNNGICNGDDLAIDCQESAATCTGIKLLMGGWQRRQQQQQQ